MNLKKGKVKKILFLMFFLIYSTNEANVCTRRIRNECCHIQSRGQNFDNYNHCRSKDFNRNICRHFQKNSPARNRCCCQANMGIWSE